jgi:hypothetical protein
VLKSLAAPPPVDVNFVEFSTPPVLKTESDPLLLVEPPAPTVIAKLPSAKVAAQPCKGLGPKPDAR